MHVPEVIHIYVITDHGTEVLCGTQTWIVTVRLDYIDVLSAGQLCPQCRDLIDDQTCLAHRSARSRASLESAPQESGPDW